MLETPRQKRAEHFAKLRAQGEKVLTLKAPCCGEEMDVAAAPERSTIHTMIDCVGCSAVLSIAVTDNKVTALLAGLNKLSS